MNVEYVISRGEGTLLDHGVMEWWVLQELIMPKPMSGETVMFEPCDDDAETGR